MSSEAASSLESPSVSKRKAHAPCALLFVFLGHPLLALADSECWTKCRCSLSSLVSLISLISRAEWTHLLMSHQTKKVQFLLLELKGGMVQIWNRVALKSTWAVCSAHCSAHSQSPQGCTELELKTFLCFVSLLRGGRVCGRTRNCKTWINGRKSNQAAHTDIHSPQLNAAVHCMTNAN